MTKLDFLASSVSLFAVSQSHTFISSLLTVASRDRRLVSAKSIVVSSTTKSVFRFCVRLEILRSKSGFPNRKHPKLWPWRVFHRTKLIADRHTSSERKPGLHQRFFLPHGVLYCTFPMRYIFRCKCVYCVPFCKAYLASSVKHEYVAFKAGIWIFRHSITLWLL